MNFRCLGAIAVVCGCALPVRAEYISLDELSRMRFASLWPDSKPQTPHPAVVRVIATDRNSMSLGSGTLVDANEEYGLVITNWHVVRDAVGPVEVVFPDGFHSMAGIVRTDREWDLAALLIWKPPGVQPVPVSTTAPRPGDMLTIAGYGSGNYKMQSGACTEYLAPAPGRPLEIVELAAAARHGDSGGPILNSRGELAGVLFGEGGGHTDGSYGGRVNQFLQLAANDLRSLPASSGDKSAPANSAVAQAKNDRSKLASAAQFAGGISESAPSGPAEGIVSGPASPQWADRTIASRPASNDRRARPLAMAAESPAGPATGRAPSVKGPSIVWKDELKTFLAAFGVAAIVLHVFRLAVRR
jgi:S1-C subfamily serine protease